MEDGKITLVEDDLVNAAYRVTRRLVKKFGGSLITVFYGEDADENSANVLSARLQERFPNVEVNVINGGQRFTTSFRPSNNRTFSKTILGCVHNGLFNRNTIFKRVSDLLVPRHFQSSASIRSAPFCAFIRARMRIGAALSP